MNKNTLCIIGNGFDLHHGIQSKYVHFSKWLERKNSHLKDVIEKYLSYESHYDSLWDDFEKSLGLLNEDDVVAHCNQYEERLSNTANTSGPAMVEANLLLKKLTDELQMYFKKWVDEIVIPERNSVQGGFVKLPENSFFLNFNYTDTLEKIYSVPRNEILYIHGKANCNAPIVLGHNVEADVEEEDLPTMDLTEDQREALADQYSPHLEYVKGKIFDYYESHVKQTQLIIDNNSHFFNSLGNLKEIVVMGHSMGEVDIAYYEEIIARIDTNAVKWKISIYDNKSKQNIVNIMNSFKISEEAITYFSLQELMY